MTDRDEAGRFLPGNRFWEARSSAGPKPKFEGSDALWSACVEYFEWNVENPLYEDKLVSFQGIVTHEPVAKMRAMTMYGLCQFLDIHFDTWCEWKKSRPDLSDAIARAESVIKRQKFEGAAADLLNPNIIAKDLGLADRQQHEHSGPDGKPIQTEDVSARDILAHRLAGIAAKD